MAWPTVTIKILNMMKGLIPSLECHFLFVVCGAKSSSNERNLIMVDSSTDFTAEEFSNIEVEHLQALKAAQLNAKADWTAGVMILSEKSEWEAAVFKANETSSFEAFVLVFPADNKELLEQAAALRTQLKAKLGRETFAICTTPAIDSTEKGQTWAQWLEATVSIQKSVASQYITVVPQVHLKASTIGIYAGRLANKEVSIADSPARVKTGSVLGSTDLAKDKNGKSLELAYLRTLESNRFAVPVFYPDYPGQYWTTGRTLDVPGGDYQDIRHIRVAMKAARKVRLRAIARIADREFNSTPGSMANAKLDFTQDLREMAKTTKIGDYEFPGEIKTPGDKDISITWINDEEVEILLAVTPFECPVKITIGIMLSKRLGE